MIKWIAPQTSTATTDLETFSKKTLTLKFRKDHELKTTSAMESKDDYWISIHNFLLWAIRKELKVNSKLSRSRICFQDSLGLQMLQGSWRLRGHIILGIPKVWLTEIRFLTDLQMHPLKIQGPNPILLSAVLNPKNLSLSKVVNLDLESDSNLIQGKIQAAKSMQSI